MRYLASPTILGILALYMTISSTICKGFLSECIIPNGVARLSASATPSGITMPASMLQAAKDSQSANSLNDIEPKISYRMAKLPDVSHIAELLYSVFEDDEGETDGESQGETAESEDDDANNNMFMWDSLAEEKSEPQLSREEQLEIIQQNLSKRMVDAKKEDSLPHLFLVATIPSTEKQEDNRVIGFLEMGTLPPPIPNSPIGKVELPYIGNVAVSNDVRRRKVGSTLVKLATKIATKWCAPSSETPFPPFLFLSVERDNVDALKFYDRLGFEELSTAKKSVEKIYLAQELNN